MSYLIELFSWCEVGIYWLLFAQNYGTILIDISMGQFPTQHVQKSRIPATKAIIYA